MGWYFELKELLLGFRGVTEKGGDPQQRSWGLTGRTRAQEEAPRQLLDERHARREPSLQPTALGSYPGAAGQVNHSFTQFHFSSLSVPVGPGCPTNPTAELRRGTERHVLMLMEARPLQTHQGLSRMQRLKSPTVKAAETTCPASRGGSTSFLFQINAYIKQRDKQQSISNVLSALASLSQSPGPDLFTQTYKLPTGRLTRGSTCKRYRGGTLLAVGTVSWKNWLLFQKHYFA